MRHYKVFACFLAFLSLSLTLLSGCSNNNNNESVNNYQYYYESNSIISEGFYDFGNAGTQLPFINERERYSHPPYSAEVIKPYEKGFEFSANDIDVDLITENLIKIASNIRRFGTEGEQITTDFIYERLIEYGWLPYFHDFTVYRQSGLTTNLPGYPAFGHHTEFFIPNPYGRESLGTGRNVLAVSENHDETKPTIFLVAHHDTQINHSGVINNATGVAVLLEIARLMSDFNGWFNIQFFFTGAEQYFRTGSRVFVSELSESERANIIGAVNVDMVGEIGAGDIHMRTPTGTPERRGDGRRSGRHNIMTLMMGGGLDLIARGDSDELSFFMGQIPAVTLADANPNLGLMSGDYNDELPHVDPKQLAAVVELVINYLLNFHYDVYRQKLDNPAHTSNITLDKVTGAINHFQLVEINDILVGNGYDSITEYVYENPDGRRFTMTERRTWFAPADLFGISQPLHYLQYYPYNPEHFRFTWYFAVEAETGDFVEILYKTNMYFGTISGEVTLEEIKAFLEQYYRNEYSFIFNSEPDILRFSVR